jgi:hypothetical protein
MYIWIITQFGSSSLFNGFILLPITTKHKIYGDKMQILEDPGVESRPGRFWSQLPLDEKNGMR